MVKKEMNLQQARNDLKKKRKVSDIKFKNKGVSTNTTTGTITDLETTTNLGKYADQYKKLINEKIITKQDLREKLVEDVIRNRKKVIQHRLIGTIILHLEAGINPTIVIPKLLLEHEGAVKETFLGQEIWGGSPPDNTLIPLVRKLMTELNKDDVTTFQITQEPLEKKHNKQAKCIKVTIQTTYR